MGHNLLTGAASLVGNAGAIAAGYGVNSQLQGLSSIQAPTHDIYEVSFYGDYVLNGKSQSLGDIVAWLGEDGVDMAVGSAWSSPFGGFLSSFSGGVLGGLAGAAGISFQNQFLTFKTWHGSSYLSLSLPMVFQAETNPVTDVILPVVKLMGLSMPSKGPMGMFRPPGPSAVDIQTLIKKLSSMTTSSTIKKDLSTVQSYASSIEGGGEDIAVNLGNYLDIPGIIIEKVVPKFSSSFDRYGNPIRAEVTVSFSTWTIPNREDLYSYFTAVAQALQSSQTSPAYQAPALGGPTIQQVNSEISSLQIPTI